MNQLFTFNSEQFTANLRPALPKRMPHEEQKAQQLKGQRNTSTFRSKKQMKRYQLIMDTANSNAARLDCKKQLSSNQQLRNYVAGHFSNSAVGLEPAALKLLPRRDTSELQAKSKRCNSEMDATKPQENMLFTFYPRETEHNETLASSDLSQEANLHKLQLRSLSLKNAPIVDFRNSNKILPRVFRMKGRPEEEGPPRKKNLSELSAGEEGEEREGALKELNRAERRNYCIKNLAMRNKTEMWGNERLHPLKHIQLLRTLCRNQ